MRCMMLSKLRGNQQRRYNLLQSLDWKVENRKRNRRGSQRRLSCVFLERFLALWIPLCFCDRMKGFVSPHQAERLCIFGPRGAGMKRKRAGTESSQGQMNLRTSTESPTRYVQDHQSRPLYLLRASYLFRNRFFFGGCKLQE